MKKCTYLLLFLPVMLLICQVAPAQQTNTKPPVNGSIYDQLNSRVDNMGYWMKMAERGLTPYNPAVEIPPAIYRGTRISGKDFITDSPDVPVTTITATTQSENSVFVDPDDNMRVLNSNNSTDFSGGSASDVYGADYFVSPNAGNTWTGSINGAGGSNSGDPTTAISRDGRMFVNYISDPGGQGVAYSDNSGTTWSTATIAPNPGSLADKNHMWIDNSLTSSYQGYLYAAWTDFGGTDDTEIKISRSTNDGASWSTGVNISSAINAGSHNQGVNIQTGPNGEVYVAWAVYDGWPTDETAIGFAKSTDGGATYSTATRIISNIKGIRTTETSKNHRVNSFPVMAVDISGGPNNGYIYIVWTNVGVPGTNTGTNESVYMIRSTNGGTTWSTPIRVNQGPNTAGKEAYFPWITSDIETGALAVIFYDDRNTTSTMCETWVAVSSDAGNTWNDFRVSDVAFTPTPITGLASSYMGDYLGITSKGGRVYPCWTDTRNSEFKTYVSPFELGLNAGFSANPTTLCTGSPVTFTDASSGPPASWSWSFPGGTPSGYAGQTPPAITYNTPGIYDVSLTVSDGTDTDTETRTGYITVKNLIADFTGAPTTVVVGNTVTFTDNSSCSPATWEWSFPGGAPSSYTGQTPPAITYNTVGTYDVTLTVTKPGASDAKTRTGYITVTPPIFNMTNGTVTTCAGDFYDSGGSSGSYANNEALTETFYPSTPGNMVRMTFSSFSTESGYDYLRIYDGTSTSAPLIGTYNGTTGPGTVTATNASGALTFNFTSDGSVVSTGWAAAISCYNTATPPVANFSATPLNTTTTQTVTFTDLSTNGPTSWLWSFSPNTLTYVDGTSATSQNPHVQFTALGQYTVTLTATNTYGSDGETKTNYISVTNCTVMSYPWSEGFENGGTIPTCWTQEQVNSSGVNWVFITGNGTGYPATAHGGTYDACLKDGNSADNKTRLITPALDLTNLPSPQLTFWHTQAYWSPDQDILTVYYRTSPTAAWTQLAIYTNNITTWTQETISLPSASATYQINFEGNAKWGRGVCLDDVTVSSACTTIYPVDVTVAASANPVDEGTEVTFTATPSHGGTTPTYQWKVNGSNAGTNSSTYTYEPADGDAVTCVLTSNESCVTGNPATSNTVTMTVNSVPANLDVMNVTVTNTQCFDATNTITVAGNGTTVTVEIGGIARMYAGERIIYNPGTWVKDGGYMLGTIVPGGPYCPPDTKISTEATSAGPVKQAERSFFRVYPNPTSGTFTLALDGYVPSDRISVVIYDMQGAIITTAEMVNEMKHEFTLSGKPAGLYLIKVTTGYQNGSSRIVLID